MKIPFLQVDAFAREPFTGNPAAVMSLDAWLDDTTLQRIAAENNLSETAFILPDATGTADFELRWFTPTSEVALCGHATLASGHAILGTAPLRERVSFLTRKSGVLMVTRDGDDYCLSLPAWKPEPKPLPAILAGLGLKRAVETLWHPQRYGLVIVEDEAIVRGLDPDFRRLAAEGDLLTIVSARGRETDIVSRAFAPGAGIDEDPVTGSAHCCLTPFWSRRLGKTSFVARQLSRRGGELRVRLDGDRVRLAGRAVEVMRGEVLA